MLGKKVGIDLGSTNVRLSARGEGLLAVEPSLVAVDGTADRGERRIVAMGAAALEASSRPGVELVGPIGAGVVADGSALNLMVSALVGRACGRQRIFKPDLMVAVASNLDGAGRRAVLDACTRAGARTAYLVDAPLAAALGAGLAVQAPVGRLVMDAGGGTVDIAVLAEEGGVSGRCLRRGGAALSAAVAAHLEGMTGLRIPARLGEEAKRSVGSAVLLDLPLTVRLDLGADGCPLDVRTADLDEPIQAWLTAVTGAIREVLADTPSRILTDVRERTGLVLCGGGSMLRGLDRHLSRALAMSVEVSPDPVGCGARGTLLALESLDLVRRTFQYVR